MLKTVKRSLAGWTDRPMHYSPKPAHSQPKPLDDRIILKWSQIQLDMIRNVFNKHGDTILIRWLCWNSPSTASYGILEGLTLNIERYTCFVPFAEFVI